MLIVDDDPHAHFFTQRALRQGAGVEDCIDAYDGEQGIAAIRANHDASAPPITHVVLDLQMPVLDGFGFLEAFDALPEPFTKHIEVILVTSSPNPDDCDRALEHRCVRAVFDKFLRREDAKAIIKT